MAQTESQAALLSDMIEILEKVVAAINQGGYSFPDAEDVGNSVMNLEGELQAAIAKAKGWTP